MSFWEILACLYMAVVPDGVPALARLMGYIKVKCNL